jgi:hypothetical protein
METTEILNTIFRYIGITGVVLFATGVVLVVIFAFGRERQYRRFTKHLKKKDPIKFYIGEEKHYGKAIYVGQIFVDISYFNFDTNCSNTIRMQRYELYPIFGFRYQPLQP